MIKYLDSIADKIAFKIAKILYKAGIKPMSVTITRFIIVTPASFYFFSRGTYIANIIGLLIYVVLAFLDIADGDMAQMYRLPQGTKPFGKLIDHVSDRILMLVVLGALLYAGMTGINSNLWILIAVAYYSVFFLITTLMFEFDRTFSLDIHSYPEIRKKMYQINSSPSISDRILYNILYVHNNTFMRIFFTHNFLLFFGIIANQLLFIFIYFAIMHFVRSVGIFLIVYRTLHMKPTNSTLVKALRKFLL